MPKLIEVFTAGCPLCEPVVEMAKRAAGTEVEVLIHDVNTDAARQAADDYAVKTVPALVVDGSLLGCCRNTGPQEQELVAAL